MFKRFSIATRSLEVGSGGNGGGGGGVGCLLNDVVWDMFLMLSLFNFSKTNAATDGPSRQNMRTTSAYIEARGHKTE